MRRLAVAMAVGGALTAAPVAADPAHGPIRVEVGGNAFTPADPDGASAHDAGATYAVTFDQAGTWRCHCRVHPAMTARLRARVLKLGGLAAGRYALAVTALDATTGKPANTVRRTLTLR